MYIIKYDFSQSSLSWQPLEAQKILVAQHSSKREAVAGGGSERQDRCYVTVSNLPSGRLGAKSASGRWVVGGGLWWRGGKDDKDRAVGCSSLRNRIKKVKCQLFPSSWRCASFSLACDCQEFELVKKKGYKMG